MRESRQARDKSQKKDSTTKYESKPDSKSEGDKPAELDLQPLPELPKSFSVALQFLFQIAKDGIYSLSFYIQVCL